MHLSSVYPAASPELDSQGDMTGISTDFSSLESSGEADQDVLNTGY